MTFVKALTRSGFSSYSVWCDVSDPWDAPEELRPAFTHSGDGSVGVYRVVLGLFVTGNPLSSYTLYGVSLFPVLL